MKMLMGALIFTACGPSARVDADGRAPPGDASAVDVGGEGHPEAAPVPPDTMALRTRIQEMIAKSPCPTFCPEVAVTGDPDGPLDESRGQRILLLDDAILTAAVARYPSRIIAFIRNDPQRAFEEYKPIIEIGTDAREILAAIDAEPGEVAARDLDLIGPFYEKFRDVVSDEVGHGSDIFSFLAERLPGAQFVVGENQGR